MKNTIMMVVAIFIIGSVLSTVMSGVWFTDSSVNVLNKLAGFTAGTENSASGGYSLSPVTWFNALVTIFTWNYPYLDYPWAVFIKIPLWIISVGAVWGFIEFSVYAVSNLLGRLRSMLGV